MSLDIAAIPHAEAIVAAINAAGGNAFLADDVKTAVPLPAFFTEVYVMARTDENARVGALGGITGARVITRNVAGNQRTAENQRAKTATALLGKSITVGSEVFGPIRRELVDDPIGDDGNGFWSGTSSWIYA